jgi:hypothetical protein
MMDERLQAFLWILGSFGVGGALGATFGAVAGGLYWRAGGAAGTRLAQRVVDAFGRFAERDFTVTTKGALVGAIDGFVFLGVVGTLIGVVAMRGGPEHTSALGKIGVGATLLVAGAIFFGVLAYTLTHVGVKALGLVCSAGIGGALIGLRLTGAPGLMFGSVLGVVAGNGLALIVFRAGRQVPLEDDEAPDPGD